MNETQSDKLIDKLDDAFDKCEKNMDEIIVRNFYLDLDLCTKEKVINELNKLRTLVFNILEI